MYSLDDFEIVHTPVPENETPRQMLLRMTGHDFDTLETCTWEFVREYPPMRKWMEDVLARLSKPQIILKQK
jgi:hypothetical protein